MRTLRVVNQIANTLDGRPKAPSGTFLRHVSAEPDSSFDRQAFEARVLAQRTELPPIIPGAYDAVKFLVAVEQFQNHPATLTDADIAQLKLVDDDIGNAAMAARAGYTKRSTTSTNDEALAQVPVSALALITVVSKTKDRIGQWISTVQRLARETKVRVDALEQRLVNPKDQSTTLSQAVTQIKALTERVNYLEARPVMEYQGTFQAGRVYRPGHAVTFKNSTWVALQRRPRRRPTGSPLVRGRGSWPYRASRDGKDAPSVR